MSSSVIVALWATVGAAAGCMLGWWAPRLLTTTHQHAWLCSPQVMGPATAVLFGLVAWRSGNAIELALGSTLAAVSPPLSALDVLEQRLPVRLVWPGYVLAGSLVAVGGIITRRAEAPVRALAAMVALLALYGLISLLSRGGLQLGDIRLAGLHGLILGWQSWQAVVSATALTFTIGGIAGVVTIARHGKNGSTIPFGPAMSFGALAVLVALAPKPV